jgi:hypothetical protein
MSQESRYDELDMSRAAIRERRLRAAKKNLEKARAAKRKRQEEVRDNEILPPTQQKHLVRYEDISVDDVLAEQERRLHHLDKRLRTVEYTEKEDEEDTDSSWSATSLVYAGGMALLGTAASLTTKMVFDIIRRRAMDGLQTDSTYEKTIIESKNSKSETKDMSRDNLPPTQDNTHIDDDDLFQ